MNTAEIRSAQSELLDLAAAMRPDWDRDALSGALASARSSGWPWPKAFLAACRLLCDPDAGPRDLLAETRSPVAKPAPADDGVLDRGAALARSELARALIEAELARDGGAG